jgi:hypothetical protein
MKEANPKISISTVPIKIFYPMKKFNFHGPKP